MADFREPIKYENRDKSLDSETTETPSNVFSVLDMLGLTIQRIDELEHEKRNLIAQYQKLMSKSEAVFSDLVNRPEQGESECAPMPARYDARAHESRYP